MEGRVAELGEWAARQQDYSEVTGYKVDMLAAKILISASMDSFLSWWVWMNTNTFRRSSVIVARDAKIVFSTLENTRSGCAVVTGNVAKVCNARIAELTTFLCDGHFHFFFHNRNSVTI